MTIEQGKYKDAKRSGTCLWLTMPPGYELYVDSASLVFHKWLVGLYADRNQVDNLSIGLCQHLYGVIGETTLSQRPGSVEQERAIIG